jgi:hypothetical protein
MDGSTASTRDAAAYSLQVQLPLGGQAQGLGLEWQPERQLVRPALYTLPFRVAQRPAFAVLGSVDQSLDGRVGRQAACEK